MNFLMSIIGAAVIVATGVVIGFWLEVALTPPLPNGFKECKDCGVTFAETARWWRQR